MRGGRFGQLWDGLRLRCPACHEGRLFASTWLMNEACGRCGAAFESDEGDWTGAIQLAQAILGLASVFGFFALVAAGVPMAWVLAFLGVVVVLVPLVFYRNIKGLWVGAYYAGRDL